MKNKIPLNVADAVAADLVNDLTPGCKRIAIAGSVRRRRASVGDLEIVAIPTVDLYDLTDSWLASNVIRHTDPKRWGSRLRSFRLAVKGLEDDVQVDLFLQPDPATWGVNMLLRTGSAEFSRKMVTKRSAGGFMPDGYQVRDARVWAGARLLETHESGPARGFWRLQRKRSSSIPGAWPTCYHRSAPIGTNRSSVMRRLSRWSRCRFRRDCFSEIVRQRP